MQQTEITALAVVGILIILDYITGLVKAAMQQVARKKREHRSKGDDRIVRQYSRRK